MTETAMTATKPRRKTPYKWIVLSNTTLGTLMATLANSSIMIALPDIFRGIQLDPLSPANFSYLLWMLMGYGLVVSVLVVTLGRIGDIFGRVRMYNLGFVIFSCASIALSAVWGTGASGALQIILFRIVQAIGGAMLMANSAAIITDAFPANERGMALGINQIAALGGSFLGLVIGGALASVNWRWVFLVNVPIGLFGTVWAYLKLKDTGKRQRAHIDWFGNIAFAAALTLLLLGASSGIQPYGDHHTGWSNPAVIAKLAGGLVMLAIFVIIERHTTEPLFDLKLFKIRPFTAGTVAVLCSQIANGGMQFMFIMWLQGIWLPIHGYSFEKTPLMAGLLMLPLTLGFLLSGPFFGRLSDKYGARPFTAGGMVLAAITFLCMTTLPANFPYPLFALMLFVNGIAFGMFGAPNTAAIMNSVPAKNRGAAAGMRSMAQMGGQPLSMAICFSLMVTALSKTVPTTLFNELTAHSVSAAVATQLSQVSPTSYLFAAFLGYNPLQTLLDSVLDTLPQADAATLVSKTFFPNLIGSSFIDGLGKVLVFSAVMCLIAAVASLLRGRKFVHAEAGYVGGHSTTIHEGNSSEIGTLDSNKPASLPDSPNQQSQATCTTDCTSGTNWGMKEAANEKTTPHDAQTLMTDDKHRSE